MNNPDYDSIWMQLCSELRIKLPENHYSSWEENFRIEKLEKNKLTIGYYDELVKEYIAETFPIEIANAANISCGGLVSVKYKKVKRPVINVETADLGSGNKFNISIKNLIAAVICVLIALCFLVVGVNFVKNFDFSETFYGVNSRKVYEPFRIIQISDLHETSYGSNNAKLIDRIQKLEPDIIVFTGDIVESAYFNESTKALFEACAEICFSFYVYGNNEEEVAFNNTMTKEDLDAAYGNITKLVNSDSGLRKAIEDTGVKVLMNDYVTVFVNGNSVDIFGCLTANPSAFWDYAGVNFNKFINENTGNFKLFLTHEPYVFSELDEDTFGDAALAGHTHGGVVNLPVFGAAYEKNYGILPEFRGYTVSGKTRVNNTQLIIDRGLTNKGLIRISNQPELVIIDVNGH